MTEERTNASNLDLVSQYEEADRPTARIITNIKEDLTMLAPEDPVLAVLAGYLEEFTRRLQPMLEIVYGEESVPGPDDQGRGMVFKDPDPTRKEGEIERLIYEIGLLHIYIKGGGARDLRGFPTNESKKIMYESVGSSSQRPRPLGALSVRQALNEYATNLVRIFYMARTLPRVPSSEEIIGRGFTIPIGVMENPQLTEYIQKIILNRAASLSDDDPDESREKEFLLRQRELDPLGSLGLIVPGSQRIGRVEGGIEFDGTHKDLLIERMRGLIDPKIVARIAEELRGLLDMGLYFNYDNGHGQNVIEKGGLADIGDAISLGDIKDPRSREMVIFYQLARHTGMAPPAYPRTKLGISSETVDVVQAIFWEKLLKGLVSPRAIDRLPFLMITMSRQVHLAAARLLVQRTTLKEQKAVSDQWEDLALLRRKILGKSEYARFGAIDDLDYEIKKSTSGKYMLEDFGAISGEDDAIGAQAMFEFLKTGDESFLEHPKLVAAIKVAEAIERLPSQDRDKLRERIGNLQHKMCLNWVGQEVKVNLGFDDRHLDLIYQKINSGDFVNANRIINILSAIVDMEHSEVDMRWEKPSKFYFTREILKDEADLLLLYAEVVEELASRTADSL